MNDLGNLFSIPENLIFPNEINEYFKEKVTVLLHENSILQNNLNEKEKQCALLEKEILEIKQYLRSEDSFPLITRLNKSSTAINTKIVELSKSLREKCAELEKYKTKCSKLTTHIEELQRTETVEAVEIKHKNSLPQTENKSEIKSLQEKLNTTINKLLEIKNANAQLKNDLMQANKFILQEIGDGFESLKLNTNWKGRAQIICDLQEKNKRLKEKLNERKLPVKENHHLDKISGKIANLEKENGDLTSLNESLKTKVDSLKSKCNRLVAEKQDIKSKMFKLSDENGKNASFIAELNRKVAETEAEKKKCRKVIDEEIQKANVEVKRLLKQNEKLEKLLHSSKECNIIGETNTCQCHQNHETLNLLQEEKSNLLKLLDLYKKRLEQARNEQETVQQCLLIEKQKCFKLEIAMAKSDLDSASSSRSGYSMGSQSQKATEQLKDQLQLAEENIKALKMKLSLEQFERKEDFREFTQLLKLNEKQLHNLSSSNVSRH